MTTSTAQGLRDHALQLAFAAEAARHRWRSARSLARDALVGILLLAAVGAVISVGSFGLELFTWR